MTMQTTLKILDGKATARTMRDEVARGCAELLERHAVVPGLTVLLVGEDTASQIYVRNKAKAATEAGMGSNIVRLPASTGLTEILDNIAQLPAG